MPIDELVAWDLENEWVERKASAFAGIDGEARLGLTRRILETIAAFLNSDGGVVVIGVGDEGEIVGLERDLALMRSKQKWKDAVVRLMVDRLDKNAAKAIDVAFHSTQEGTVGVIYCPPHFEPVELRKKGQGDGWEGPERKMFVRTEGSNRGLSALEAINYHRRHWPDRG